ncbi:MAG: hypothetical protein JJ975_10990 [Bacteroidia bacterium]|nr:hypothetical protein [Bacteroidia bacterium]
MHNTSRGLVSFCDECRKFQLCFGTCAIQFEVGEFRCFCEFVQHHDFGYSAEVNIKDKRIPLPGDFTNLLLTTTEYESLKIVLGSALASLQIEQMLGDMGISTNRETDLS